MVEFVDINNGFAIMSAFSKEQDMTTPQDIAASPERASIGRWFDSVSDLVENFPTRIGTQNARIVFYDASFFKEVSVAFNEAAMNTPKLAPAHERAVAARHVYRLTPAAAPDETPAADHAMTMVEKMNRLKQLCAKHHIGVTVHATKDGDLQITLIEQVKPKRQFKIKPPKIKFGRGF